MSRLIYIAVLVGFFIACSTDDQTIPGPEADTFDRKAMLTDWADGLIIPRYEVYLTAVDSMKKTALNFTSAPSVERLDTLRSAWLEAYTRWQYVSIFEIGKAEEIQLRNFSNIYPADTSGIRQNVMGRSYSLLLPSTMDEQGFPALDYLLNGLAGNDQGIVNVYLGDQSWSSYLNTLTGRLSTMSHSVLDDWKSGYRESFINNVASSATGSVDKLVNDYVYYYEKHLRAGKIGIPAGVFSGKTEPQTVEAYFAGDVSKSLLLHALDACQSFFNGTSVYDSYDGLSLSSYLDYLNTIKTGTDLSALINAQFENSRIEIMHLSDDFRQQIMTDNLQMLEAYDQLQLNVILLKVDMMQALNVRVDYVDADGD